MEMESCQGFATATCDAQEAKNDVVFSSHQWLMKLTREKVFLLTEVVPSRPKDASCA